MRDMKHAGAVARRARAAFALVLVAALLAWLVVASGACLPDLAALPAAEDAAFEAAPAVFRGCGDGLIETLDDGGDAGESCDPGDAAVRGCSSSCALTCEGTFDPVTGHCYFVAGADTSYNAALGRCRIDGAHVVTFSTTREVSTVAALVDGGAFWVGLSLNSGVNGFESAPGTEPGLPLSPISGPCEGCFAVGADGGELPIETPDASLPNCVVSRGTSGWARRECSGATALTTVCEREPVGFRSQSCIGGFCFNVAKTAGAKTYILGVDSLTAAAARDTCQSLDNGRLVVFASPEEREEVVREILERFPEAAEQTYWIGLASDGGTWTWEDGVVASGDAGAARASVWGDRQPDGGAATSGARAFIRLAASYDTQLAFADDGRGTTTRRYLCERPPR